MITNIHNQRGMALAFTLVFLILVVFLVAGFILMTVNGFGMVNRAADEKRAYYIADAGLSDAYIQLREALIEPGAFNVTNGAYNIGSGKNGGYSVNVSVSGTAPFLTYTISSTGTYNQLSKTLILTVKQTSISTFAYLSNTEHHPVWGDLWWITGMLTDGPVRSNGQFNIWGSPVFNGSVTQAGAAINYWNGGPPVDNPVFAHGLTLGAPKVNLPTAQILNNISSAASSAGLVLSGNSTVIFKSDGTLNVTNAVMGWNNQNIAIPANGTIFVQGGDAYVKGTVKGKVTVAAENEVFITGNIVYNSDPRVDSTSTDILGLIAKNNVTVTAASSPTNLEIDAVMVALTGSFQVDQWWVPGKGNMVQYGSLTNNYSGPTGIFDPSTGTLFGGYNQLQSYDDRLLTMVPPSFPAATEVSGKRIYVKTGFREI